MKRFMHVFVALSALCVLGVFQIAGATGMIDYTAMTTGAQGEVTTALTAAGPFLAVLLGVIVGYALFAKFIKKH